MTYALTFAADTEMLESICETHAQILPRLGRHRSLSPAH